MLGKGFLAKSRSPEALKFGESPLDASRFFSFWSVVRDGGNIPDRSDIKTMINKGPKGRVSATTNSFYDNVDVHRAGYFELFG